MRRSHPGIVRRLLRELSHAHLLLGKDAPLERAIQPTWTGPIVAIPPGRGACTIATTNRRLTWTRVFSESFIRLRCFLLLNGSTQSASAFAWNLNSFGVIRKNCGIAKGARIKFLVGDTLQESSRRA
jgi:hypothetical protein